MKDQLARVVDSVLKNDNCTGCGGCALVSKRVQMSTDPDGFSRPSVAAASPSMKGSDTDEARLFRAMCPGLRVTAPPAPEDGQYHPIFGSYVSVWEATAVDPETRRSGSSGGVLTALSGWLVETGRAKDVTGVRSDVETPRKTVPVRILSREEALAASGSRYAPVPTLTGWQDSSEHALVAKPCEVSAARQLHAATDSSAAMPVTMSFFCAGTPSQSATDNLIEALGVDPTKTTFLKYRGDGWPGKFIVTSPESSASLSYDESWGKHLGRQLQWRCKICVDGTGAHADISVGDFWDADENGYPLFTESDGNSVAIARTSLGDELLRAAARDGVIAIVPATLEKVAAIQPLQVQRRSALLGRLAGRWLAGKSVPKYRGYRLVPLAMRNLVLNGRGLVGTFLRSMRSE